MLFAEKNYQLEKHPEVDVRNLFVIKLMQSFKSREYVKERFAWRHYYWFLTPKGVEYLREYLNLPEDIVPATHKQRARPDRSGGGPPRRFEGRGGPSEGGDYRGGYRGGPSKEEKALLHRHIWFPQRSCVPPGRRWRRVSAKIRTSWIRSRRSWSPSTSCRVDCYCCSALVDMSELTGC